MSDATYIGGMASRLESTPPFQTYSRVVIHVSDDADDDIVVGNSTGRTLEVDNPWGTVAMAQNMLSALNGYQYQPYTAYGAALNPAAEIGDAVTVGDVYGGIYTRQTAFGRLMKADISAPQDEEIDHEYKFESPERREFSRQIGEVRASLAITNQDISAKVDRQSPTGQTSFSWLMNDTSHTWYANGQEVMRVSASGLSVTGEIKATSGKIGNFNISATAIWNNIDRFGGTQSSGVYIGTNGIQLGQNFKVDSSGNVTASNMVLSGRLTVGGAVITAEDLRMGAQRANSGYQSWNSTTGTVVSNAGYWTSGYNYGLNWNGVKDYYTSSRPYVYFGSISVGGNGTPGTITADGLITAGGGLRIRDGNYYRTVYPGTVKDAGGVYQNVLRWS